MAVFQERKQERFSLTDAQRKYKEVMEFNVQLRKGKVSADDAGGHTMRSSLHSAAPFEIT